MRNRLDIVLRMRNPHSLNRSFARIGASILLIAIGTGLGCSNSSLPQPTPILNLSLTSVVPNNGPTTGALGVRIFGTGFQPGAALLVDNLPVDSVVVSDRLITATMPIHAAGSVDVVVTNSGGQSASMPGGFTFADFSLVPSADVVTAGSSLSVSWIAPGLRSTSDWVALFTVGTPSSSYGDGWWAYTNGVASGTLTLTAPNQPGQDQFRYFLDDGFVLAGRSHPVTVTPGASSAVSRSIVGDRAGGK